MHAPLINKGKRQPGSLVAASALRTAAIDSGRGGPHQRLPLFLQAKLSMGATNDAYEQEADRVADEVTRMPQPNVQHACSCGGACPKCQSTRLDQNHGLPKASSAYTDADAPSIQRSPAPGNPAAGGSDCHYEKDEESHSQSAAGILELDIGLGGYFGIDPGDAVVIADFQVNHGELRPSALQDLRDLWLPTFNQQELKTLEIIGYSDCVGRESRNKPLREQRAKSVAHLFPTAPVVGPAKHDEHLIANTSAQGRALNRSVILKRPSQAPKPPTPVPKPEPEVVIITLNEPDTENCSKEQRRRLAIAFPLGEMMIRHALSVISAMEHGSEEAALLEKYFSKDAYSHRWHIKRGFVDTLRAWSRDQSFECIAQGTGGCGPITNGYIREGQKLVGGNIHICELAFGRDDEGLAETIVHEASHMLDWTDDEQYCDLQTGCSLDISDAEDNADSYSTFAQEAFNRWY